MRADTFFFFFSCMQIGVKNTQSDIISDAKTWCAIGFSCEEKRSKMAQKIHGMELCFNTISNSSDTRLNSIILKRILIYISIESYARVMEKEQKWAWDICGVPSTHFMSILKTYTYCNITQWTSSEIFK